jgi:hypothetical protein
MLLKVTKKRKNNQNIMRPKIITDKKSEQFEKSPFFKVHKEDLKEGFYYLILGAGILTFTGGLGYIFIKQIRKD